MIGGSNLKQLFSIFKFTDKKLGNLFPNCRSPWQFGLRITVKKKFLPRTAFNHRKWQILLNDDLGQSSFKSFRVKLLKLDGYIYMYTGTTLFKPQLHIYSFTASNIMKVLLTSRVSESFPENASFIVIVDPESSNVGCFDLTCFHSVPVELSLCFMQLNLQYNSKMIRYTTTIKQPSTVQYNIVYV